MRNGKYKRKALKFKSILSIPVSAHGLTENADWGSDA